MFMGCVIFHPFLDYFALNSQTPFRKVKLNPMGGLSSHLCAHHLCLKDIIPDFICISLHKSVIDICRFK